MKMNDSFDLTTIYNVSIHVKRQIKPCIYIEGKLPVRNYLHDDIVTNMRSRLSCVCVYVHHLFVSNEGKRT